MDGSLGSGLNHLQSDLSAGPHTVTAVVTDDAEVSDSVALVIHDVEADRRAAFTTPKNIGSSAESGFVQYNGASNSYTLDVGGVDISLLRDDFFYAYETRSGDFDIRARVTDISSNYAGAGLMVRKNVGTGSAHVSMMLVKDLGGLSVQR